MANGIVHSRSFLQHVQRKLREGRKLDQREYRVALAHSLYVKPELRP